MVQKIEGLEADQRELIQKIATINAQVNQFENKSHKLDTSVSMLEKDLKQVEGETNTSQCCGGSEQ